MAIRRFILNFWPFLILLFLTTLVVWPLFLPGYFSHHDDLQVMRIFEMRKCLEDFQIPCRWVPDMGFGNGYPLFNYYNVFPYYIGAIASLFLGFIGSAKLLFLFAASLAGISMYLFAREILGTYPALLSATLYMFAPYRAVDIYVRGAIAESFAIAIIPLVCYFGFKLAIKIEAKNILGLALAFAAFLTSHNIMILLFLPALLILLLIWFWKREFRAVKSLILCLFLGFGLSAFFLVPAFLEKDLVQIDNLVRFELNFRGHFVTLYQLFLDRSWGSGVSFQIGWPHWFLMIGSIFSLLFRKAKDHRLLVLYFGLLAIFIISVLMTHIRSAFIWEKIEILKFSQFPWRFLSVVIFSSSLLGGFFIYYLKGSLSKVLTTVLIAVTIALNWNYFKPYQFIFNLTDKEKLSGELWRTQQKAAILDYLPIQAVEPLEPAPDKPLIILGDAKIYNFENRSNRWKFETNVGKLSAVEMPVFDFPNWQVFVNGQKVVHSNKNYLGRISFNLSPGTFLVEGKFSDTTVRKFSNILSLVSLIILFVYYGKAGKFFK